jgi:hypothetical protein
MIIPDSINIISSTKNIYNKKRIKNKKNFFSIGVRNDKMDNTSQTNEVYNSNLTSLLCLQEVNINDAEINVISNYANQAFALLKQIQISVLDNEISPELLENLQVIMDSLPDVNDEVGKKMLEEINLRIEVEKEKYERLLGLSGKS